MKYQVMCERPKLEPIGKGKTQKYGDTYHCIKLVNDKHYLIGTGDTRQDAIKDAIKRQASVYSEPHWNMRYTTEKPIESLDNDSVYWCIEDIRYIKQFSERSKIIQELVDMLD